MTTKERIEEIEEIEELISTLENSDDWAEDLASIVAELEDEIMELETAS